MYFKTFSKLYFDGLIKDRSYYIFIYILYDRAQKLDEYTKEVENYRIINKKENENEEENQGEEKAKEIQEPQKEEQEKPSE